MLEPKLSKAELVRSAHLEYIKKSDAIHAANMFQSVAGGNG